MLHCPLSYLGTLDLPSGPTLHERTFTREQFWLYPILAGVFVMVVAHPHGLGLFPLVALAAPVLFLANVGFIVFIARHHRPKLLGVILSSCFFALVLHAIVQSTLHY